MSEYIGQYGAYTFTYANGQIEGKGNGYILEDSPHQFGLCYYRSTITHRSIADYVALCVIPPDYEHRYRDIQLLEVGPGLAQFLPVMAEVSRLPPIAVDPTDYRTIIELLEAFLVVCPNDPQTALAYELMRRAQVMLDPSKIRLYPMTLQDACRYHADALAGVAGKVVHWSVNMHNFDETYMVQLEESFLPYQWGR